MPANLSLVSKAKEARDALEGLALVVFGAYDFFEGLERGDKTVDAAKRALRRGKRRAKAVRAALAKVESEEP